MTSDQAIAPAGKAAAVTPSDATVLEPTRGLYCGVSGDVKVTMLDGTAVTFVGLAAGVVHPLVVTMVWSTGTDATSIVALR